MEVIILVTATIAVFIWCVLSDNSPLYKKDRELLNALQEQIKNHKGAGKIFIRPPVFGHGRLVVTRVLTSTPMGEVVNPLIPHLFLRRAALMLTNMNWRVTSGANGIQADAPDTFTHSHAA